MSGTGWSRRQVLGTLGAAGALGVVGAATGCEREEDTAPLAEIPRRRLGRTGLEVPILSLGVNAEGTVSHILFKVALTMGVTCWETAREYGGGRCEVAIGNHFQRYPEDRARVVLVTKSLSRDPGVLTLHLQQSIASMQTDAVDIYMLHNVSQPDDLGADLRAWVERTRAQGFFKHFGIATHENMAACLQAAAASGWVDVVLTPWNYRYREQKDLVEALDACARADVGVMAMKSQAHSTFPDGVVPDALARRVAKKGFTMGQALLKATWDHPAIATTTVEMHNVNLLTENVQAALSPVRLGRADLDALGHHARATRSSWCAACGTCRTATGLPLPTLVRGLMYAHGYGQFERAKRVLDEILGEGGDRLDPAAIARAEAVCPNGIPLASCVEEVRRVRES